MKGMKFNKTHQDKLIEMCQALFPEYDKFWIYEDTKIVLAHTYKREKRTKNGYRPAGWTKEIPDSFHWFEFCLTHLTSSLGIALAKTDIMLDVEWECFLDLIHNAVFKQDKHPVDYLYEQFKKLKL